MEQILSLLEQILSLIKQIFAAMEPLLPPMEQLRSKTEVSGNVPQLRKERLSIMVDMRCVVRNFT